MNQLVMSVVRDFMGLGRMFTVYNVWKECNNRTQQPVDYNAVRNDVEQMVNDGKTYEYIGTKWTRSIGYHLNKVLDKSVGRVGDAPQIYHPVGADITKYDPKVSLNFVPAKTVKQKPFITITTRSAVAK